MILVEIDGEQREITGSGEIHLRDLLANKPYLIEQSGIKMISHPLHFEVNGLPIKVEYSNRRKRMELVIMSDDASIVVKAPFAADRSKMENWVITNWNWIEVSRKDILNRIAARQAQNQGNSYSAPTGTGSHPDGGFQPTPSPRPDLKPSPSSTPTPSPTPSSTGNSGLGRNPNIPTGTTIGSNEVIDDSKPLFKWEINGVPVEVKYRNNLKRVKLSIIAPDAHIEIKAPYGTKASKICKFIEESWPWYLANRQKALKDEIQTSDYNDGAKLPFLGKEYTIRLILGKQKAFAAIQNDEIVISSNSKALVPSVVNGWYQENSEKLIKELVPRWSRILGVSVPKVELKFMVNCWGKCYPNQKKIVLHPQLIFHPKECFEFIVVHELCHFLEPNHSPRFYSLLDRNLPNWRQLDELINSKYILK